MTAEEKLREIEQVVKIWKLFPAMCKEDKVTETAGKCADTILEILDIDWKKISVVKKK